MEASGVACGLSWLKHDFNHASFIVVMTIEYGLLYLLAFFLLKLAKGHQDSTTVLEVNTSNWFTEKQLVWVRYVSQFNWCTHTYSIQTSLEFICVVIAFWQITFSFLMFVGIGWGPYGYFGVWSQHTKTTSISMLAVTLPPLFAKASASFYIIPYLVTSDRFRDAVLGGDNQVVKKDQ